MSLCSLSQSRQLISQGHTEINPPGSPLHSSSLPSRGALSTPGYRPDPCTSIKALNQQQYDADLQPDQRHKHIWTASNTGGSTWNDFNSFPEIAQMEREFQERILAVKNSKNCTEPVGTLSGKEEQVADDINHKTADIKALAWAQKNPWFGSDMGMTTYAYAIHDEIVANSKVDCQSEEYYDEIDKRITARFSGKLQPPSPMSKSSG